MTPVGRADSPHPAKLTSSPSSSSLCLGFLGFRGFTCKPRGAQSARHTVASSAACSRFYSHPHAISLRVLQLVRQRSALHSLLPLQPLAGSAVRSLGHNCRGRVKTLAHSGRPQKSWAVGGRCPMAAHVHVQWAARGFGSLRRSAPRSLSSPRSLPRLSLSAGHAAAGEGCQLRMHRSCAVGSDAD